MLKGCWKAMLMPGARKTPEWQGATRQFSAAAVPHTRGATLPSPHTQRPCSIFNDGAANTVTFGSYLLATAAMYACACSCELNPTVRETFSGHAEFDLVLTATSETKSE
jgi:hypothetical protein